MKINLKERKLNEVNTEIMRDLLSEYDKKEKRRAFSPLNINQNVYNIIIIENRRLKWA